MATASVNRMVLWTDLEGTELNGRWRVVRQVRSEGRTGWFEATAPDGTGVMLIITETLNDEEELMDRLRAAAEIHHPNVVAIRESLVASLEEIPMVIAVTELTEENLGDVLRERALGVEETRQVLDSMLAGLAAVHGKGLVHGRMEPSSVLATGDTIKLRSDCLHLGGENFSTAAGEDLRGLGRIVVQALTRRIPAGENDPVMQLVPEPMARAVRRALSGRATVDEIATLAGIRLVPAASAAPVPAKAAPAPAPVQAEPREPAPRPAISPSVPPASAAPVPVPAPAAKPAPETVAETSIAEPVVVAKVSSSNIAPGEQALAQADRRTAAEAVAADRKPTPIGRQSQFVLEAEEEEETGHRSFKPWIVIAAVALVVITIFVLYGMLHRSPAKQAVNAPTPQAVAPPAASQPHRAATVTRPGAVASAGGSSAATVASSGPGWRVVAYTYNHEDQARQKAESLQKRFPNLQPGVFSPRGRAPYLVTLGGVMSRADAIALRVRALRMGMPRDTYARNYR